MHLRFLGHAAFDLQLAGMRLCLDPHKPGALGGRFQLPAIQGPFDALLRSHGHEDHAAWTPALGTERWLDAPLQLPGLLIDARAAFHDQRQGLQQGLTRMLSLRGEGLRLVHSGDLGAVDDQDFQWLSDADVLMIAAGGTWTLDGAAAAKLAWQSGARAVVPMHCADPRVNLALLPVSEFLQAWPGPVVHADQLDNDLLAGLTGPTAVVLSTP